MSTAPTMIEMPASEAVATEDLVLDYASHTYRWQGMAVPGVTRTLSDAKILDYSGIPQHVLDRAAERGKAAHLALEYHDNETLDRGTLDDELEPYVRAYEAFCADSGFFSWAAEKSRYHKLRGYAGTFDRTGMLGEQATILDFKTGVVQPGHFAQLCAYAQFFPNPRRFRIIALQLSQNGTYKVHEVPQARIEHYTSVFNCALACAQFRAKEGKGK